jgi:hypothetical protein
MNLFYIFRYLYYYAFFLFVRFMRLFQNNQNAQSITQSIAQAITQSIAHAKTDIELYEEPQLAKFLKIINTLEQKVDIEPSTSNNIYNTNIDDILYKRTEFLECLKDPKNIYEEKWRRNILYETTPRGNIVMYYDVFKQGFAYYSDQTMNYTLLNVAAMKYCLYFSCLDFFIDEQVLKEHVSPFCQMIKDEETAENDKKRETMKQMLPNMTGARFAKLKNYSTQPDKSTQSDKVPEKIQEYQINKFIHLGKISNFSFLQKVPKKQISTPTTTKFDDMFADVNVINREVVNYKLFKEQQQNKRKLDCTIVD